MKKLIGLVAVVCLMLSFAGVSWAAPGVTPPPDAPEWWNAEGEYYAYGWWSADIIGSDIQVSPPDDADHWASNFLVSGDFLANVGISNETVAVDLNNVSRPDLYKQIFVYITGTATSTIQDVSTNLDTAGGVFSGGQTWTIDEQTNNWTYMLEGEIRPQPDFVGLTFGVPGMTGVTNIWAGENCIPEPITLSLLGLGGLTLIRRRTA